MCIIRHEEDEKNNTVYCQTESKHEKKKKNHKVTP